MQNYICRQFLEIPYVASVNDYHSQMVATPAGSGFGGKLCSKGTETSLSLFGREATLAGFSPIDKWIKYIINVNIQIISLI